jgi:hypothetical protein
VILVKQLGKEKHASGLDKQPKGGGGSPKFNAK